MTRHELREQAFRMLFGVEFHTEDRREALENYMDVTFDGKMTEAERQEVIEKVLDIDGKKTELDARIDSVAEGWKVSRMGKAELNILRLALYEMQYDDSVPVKVAINEAVELAKEYGSGDAHAFVNGILAKLIDRDLPEAEGEKAAAPEAAAPRQEEAPKDDEAVSL